MQTVYILKKAKDGTVVCQQDKPLLLPSYLYACIIAIMLKNVFPNTILEIWKVSWEYALHNDCLMYVQINNNIIMVLPFSIYYERYIKPALNN